MRKLINRGGGFIARRFFGLGVRLSHETHKFGGYFRPICRVTCPRGGRGAGCLFFLGVLPAPPRCISNKPHKKSVAQPWTPNPNSSTLLVAAGVEGPLQKGKHKPDPWRFDEFHIVTHVVTRVLPKTARPHPRTYHQHITSPGYRVPEKGPEVIANPTYFQKLVQQSAASTSKSAQSSDCPKPLFPLLFKPQTRNIP